jgi:general secretion pathway protein C
MGPLLTLMSSLPLPLTRLLSGPALPRVLAAVGTILVAAQLAFLTWKFLPNKAAPVAAAPVSVDTTVNTNNASRVFGEAPVVTQEGPAPQTNIALSLVGTLAVSDATAGLAIVGPTPTDAHVFATGSDIVPGVRLVEVYADHVLIDRGGVRESLNLPHAGNGVPGAAAAPTPAIAELARQVAAAPEVIGDLMRPMPNYVGGQLRGFKLFPGRDRKKFDQLGLQPGDMITQVNGVPIKDAQHGLDMLQSLGSSTSAQVTVERGGVIQSVTIDSSQLATLSDPTRLAPSGRAPAPIESPNND